MNHQYLTSATCGCDDAFCNVCVGGLSICTVCGALEGALATHCPGRRVSMKVIDDVYRGRLDFVNGEWVASSSIHSPEHYRTPVAEADRLTPVP